MSTKTTLIRGLTLTDAIAIVIGSIIGTGVFLKTATMSQLVGNPSYVMLAWVVAGALSLFGAFAYAELGSLLPDAGGEYVYLKEGYGDIWAFLYGWMRFWIGNPGTVAAYAVGAMTFASGMVDLEILGGKTTASIIVIVIFSLINCFSVAFGGAVQAFMTAIKLIMILGISAGILLFSKTGAASHFYESSATGPTAFDISAFGSAVLAALWAFDGWNNLPMVAGEVKNPQRNVPLALGVGVLAILGIYGITNIAYFYALPFSEVITSNSNDFPDALPVATKAALTFLGDHAVGILSAAFVFSAIGAMNGSIITGARVPFAMARDGLFFKQLGNVSEKTHVPVISILVQAAVSILLALSGTFDQLTDYVVFASWIFYAAVTSVVFVLRQKMPNAERPYKTIGYPILPIIFILMGILLLVNTVVTNPRGTFIGMGLILAGIPFFYFFREKNKPKNVA